MRGGTYRTGGLRLNQGITLQPYARRAPGPQGHPRGDRVGGPAQQRVEDVLDDAVPGQAPGLVAARPRGHADAAPPVQQRHGLRRRRAAAVGGLGGRARRALVLRRLRGRPGLHRRRSRRTAWSRSRRSTARSSARAGPVHGKTSDQKGPTIRGITFTQYAYRAIDIEGKKPATLVSEEPTDEPVGPADPGDLRQGGRGHDARERDDLLLLARGRLLPRRRPRPPQLADQRHQHGGHLRHRLLRRAARAEHLPPQQRRAAHRLLPGRGQDLQPVPPRHLPRQPGDRQPALERHLVRRRQPRRRLREQLGRGRARRLLLRDLARARSSPATCSCGCDKGVRVPQQLERARLPQHLRRHRRPPSSATSAARSATTSAGTRAPGPTSTSARGTSSWATCWWRASRSASRCCGSSSRRPSARSSPGRRRRRSTATSTCAPGAAGPLVVWSPVAGESCQVELGSLEELRKLAAGVRGARPGARAATRARSSGAPSCAATSSRGRCRALAPVDDLPADVATAPRLAGGDSRARRAPSRCRRQRRRGATCGGR